VSLAALRGRLTQDFERETRDGRGRHRLLHLASWPRLLLQKLYAAQR
jgi:hypothetical protein